jgi:hypothetical protein
LRKTKTNFKDPNPWELAGDLVAMLLLCTSFFGFEGGSSEVEQSITHSTKTLFFTASKVVFPYFIYVNENVYLTAVFSELLSFYFY